MDTETKIREFLDKRKSLKELLNSYSDDMILSILLMDLFSQVSFIKPSAAKEQKEESHEEFRDAIVPVKAKKSRTYKASVTPTGKLNYSPKKMRELREDAGLTQKEVEAKLGWGMSYLSNIERGRLKYMLPSIKDQLLAIYNPS